MSFRSINNCRSLDRISVHGLSTVRRIYTTNELVSTSSDGHAEPSFEQPRQFHFPQAVHAKWQVLDAEHLTTPGALHIMYQVVCRKMHVIRRLPSVHWST